MRYRTETRSGFLILSKRQHYQLELVNGRLYYHLPPGTSILSIPFVAVMNAFGVSAANPDRTHNQLEKKKSRLSWPRSDGRAGLLIFLHGSTRLDGKVERHNCSGRRIGNADLEHNLARYVERNMGNIVAGVVLRMLLKQDIRKTL